MTYLVCLAVDHLHVAHIFLQFWETVIPLNNDNQSKGERVFFLVMVLHLLYLSVLGGHWELDSNLDSIG